MGVMQGHIRALPGKFQGNLAADAGAGAGDESAFSGEFLRCGHG